MKNNIPSEVTNFQPTHADVLNQLQGTLNKNELAEVLKELFDIDKIELISDLTSDEIKLISRIETAYRITGLGATNLLAVSYMKKTLSKDRKSRKELLQAISGYQKQDSFLSRLNPFNKSGLR